MVAEIKGKSTQHRNTHFMRFRVRGTEQPRDPLLQQKRLSRAFSMIYSTVGHSQRTNSSSTLQIHRLCIRYKTVYHEVGACRSEEEGRKKNAF
jgi:hypothetical protein